MYTDRIQALNESYAIVYAVRKQECGRFIDKNGWNKILKTALLNILLFKCGSSKAL
jgi:hypothetical protein